jgi:hypothetical protein
LRNVLQTNRALAVSGLAVLLLAIGIVALVGPRNLWYRMTREPGDGSRAFEAKHACCARVSSTSGDAAACRSREGSLLASLPERCQVWYFRIYACSLGELSEVDAILCARVVEESASVGCDFGEESCLHAALMRGPPP